MLDERSEHPQVTEDGIARSGEDSLVVQTEISIHPLGLLTKRLVRPPFEETVGGKSIAEDTLEYGLSTTPGFGPELDGAEACEKGSGDDTPRGEGHSKASSEGPSHPTPIRRVSRDAHNPLSEEPQEADQRHIREDQDHPRTKSHGGVPRGMRACVSRSPSA